MDYSNVIACAICIWSLSVCVVQAVKIPDVSMACCDCGLVDGVVGVVCVVGVCLSELYIGKRYIYIYIIIIYNQYIKLDRCENVCVSRMG